NIDWVTPYAQMTGRFKNSYAEIGTTFASSVITFPTVTAHILGQLMRYKGPKHIVFGSHSLWYGSPQWQIEAFWRFKIPEKIREKYDYPKLDKESKRDILGHNSAKLYGLHPRHSKHYKALPTDYPSRITDDQKRPWERPPYTHPPHPGGGGENFAGLPGAVRGGGGGAENPRERVNRKAALFRLLPGAGEPL